MITLGHVIGHVVLKLARGHMMRHVIGSQGHMVAWGHVIAYGHMLLVLVRDHMIYHV